jgi:thioredoxin-dependent peroxiredoxin
MKLRALLFLTSLFTMACTAKSSGPLAVGDAAPQVSGVTETGATLNLAEVYAAQEYTLVYFYPKAGTSGCTAQGCSLRDSYQDLSRRGLAVIGVSTDTVAEQKAFKEANHFPFPLIADTDKAVMNAFGVPTYPGSNAAQRQAFLIKDGKIIWADYKASTAQQATDVLKVILSQK